MYNMLRTILAVHVHRACLPWSSTCFAVKQVLCARAAVQFVVSNQAAACRCHAYIRVPAGVTCGPVCMSSVAG